MPASTLSTKNRFLQKFSKSSNTRFRPDLSPYRLPIRFTLFKEGCFVTEAHQSELLLGKLIAINGIDMEEIINRFKKILYDENPSYFDISLPQYLNNTYILKGLGITQTKDSITCTFLNTDHKTISAVLKPDPKAKLRKAPSSTELRAFKGKGIYGQIYDKEQNLIYVYYRSCHVYPRTARHDCQSSSAKTHHRPSIQRWWKFIDHGSTDRFAAKRVSIP